VREQQMILAGPSRFADRYLNSLAVGFGSTLLSVTLGTLAAYAFSRFRVPGKDDWLFFILSTRMMPPIAVAIPIYLMYRHLGLNDTKLGLILLYTVVNLSLAVWLLKGFMDEIPREYEEAAMVDGYTRWQAFLRVVLPQAATGIATTAIFCLIFAWNEYAFALLLTSGTAQTAPPFIPPSSARRPRLARHGRRHHAVPAAGAGVHGPAAPAPAARRHLRSDPQMKPSVHWFRRAPWERATMGLIGLGLAMLMQPWSLDAYGYSFRCCWRAWSASRSRASCRAGNDDGRDPHRQPAEALCRHRRRARLLAGAGGRQVRRAAGAIRLRQDHHPAHAGGAGVPHRRHHHA
jgi:ABC-type glycerol-3-phosphate transport system permease component